MRTGLLHAAVTGRDVPTLGYSLTDMEFLRGFHGKKLNGKEIK